MDTAIHVLRPGEPVETLTVDLPEEPGYTRLAETIRPLLAGAELEHVAVLYEGRRADMFVDELGACSTNSRPRLPRNQAATAIYRAATVSREPSIDPESIPAIYGPAVLFERIVWR